MTRTDGQSSRENGPAGQVQFIWQDYELEPIVQRRSGTAVALGRSVQVSHASDERETSRVFTPGIAYDYAPTVRMRNDLGEGVRESRTTGRPSFYMNIVEGSVYREFEGPCEITFPAIPIADLSALVGLSEASIEHIIRPLHDGLVDDDTLPALTSAMWLAAAEERTYASLFLDQAMATMATHIFEVARGSDWRRMASLEWLDDGQARSRMRHGEAPVPVGDVRLRRAAEYAEAHLAEPLSIAELAAVAGMSPSWFRDCFRAATGMPVHGYVRERRLQRAHALLAGRRASIQQIAHECGFTDQSHLTRAFKCRFGVTPGEARNG
ncbi:MAG: AraC family transcriptional regulator [Pseudomonadota bacterium]